MRKERKICFFFSCCFTRIGWTHWTFRCNVFKVFLLLSVSYSLWIFFVYFVTFSHWINSVHRIRFFFSFFRLLCLLLFHASLARSRMRHAITIRFRLHSFYFILFHISVAIDGVPSRSSNFRIASSSTKSGYKFRNSQFLTHFMRYKDIIHAIRIHAVALYSYLNWSSESKRKGMKKKVHAIGSPVTNRISDGRSPFTIELNTLNGALLHTHATCARNERKQQKSGSNSNSKYKQQANRQQ